MEEDRAGGPGRILGALDDGRLGDLLAGLARERARVRIAEHRVGPIGFAGAVVRDPARGVGDVANQRLCHLADSAMPRIARPGRIFTVLGVESRNRSKNYAAEPGMALATRRR